MSPFGSATLLLQGPSGKVKFEITDERTTIGRTRDNEIVLQDPAVSAHHCELVADGRGLLLRDLKSSNGSYVNGRRVESGPVFDGDVLKLGQFQGRIAVRNLAGKPLKPPSRLSPAVIVVVTVVLVLGAGAAVALRVVRQRQRAAAAFGAYQTKVTTYLGQEPCSVAREGAARLRALAALAGTPRLGRHGRLSRYEKRVDRRVLATSRKREKVVADVVERVTARVKEEQAGLDQLKKMGAALPDPNLRAASVPLTSLFATRIGATESYADQWRALGTEIAQYDGLLQRLARGGDQDAADQLDGWKLKGDPRRLLDDCQTHFDATQQDGLIRLEQMRP